jgi:DNA-binding MarR family transcriptional regulator
VDFDPRDYGARDDERFGGRGADPREVFARHLDLPRGVEREIVRDRDHEYALRGSETRTLSTVGAFRVVPASNLRDHSGAPADPRSGDLRNLREQGLVETVRIPGRRDHAVVLTKGGRELLERHREGGQSSRQAYYAGLKRSRELEHDSQVYDAFLQAADRLHEQGSRIERVVLDYELKRDYQKWLHENDSRRNDYDGHPDRDEDEIRAWASEHDLPYFDDHVHFPDLRIEYEDRDGRPRHEDIEVLTIHYRGAHGSAAARSGFTCYGAGSARTGGGRSLDPRLAEELLR